MAKLFGMVFNRWTLLALLLLVVLALVWVIGPVVAIGSHDILALVTTSVGTRVKGEQSLVVPLAPHLADLRALIAK